MTGASSPAVAPRAGCMGNLCVWGRSESVTPTPAGSTIGFGEVACRVAGPLLWLSTVLVLVPPLQLRLDAKIPGTVLLRDKNGGVFFITIDNVQQVRPQARMR